MLLFRKTAMPWAGLAVLTQQEACRKMWAASRPAWPRVTAALALLLAAAFFPVPPASGQTPFKVALEDEMQLQFQTVDLNAVLQGMRSSANLVFLDACRDNPFVCSVARSMGTRSSTVGRGLARVEKDRDFHGGTFIAFATAAGELVPDGGGRNSPFTAALNKHIGVPGLVDNFYFFSPPSTALPTPSSTVSSAPRLDSAEELDSSGRPFRDCADCPEMVVVPAGRFRMGDLAGIGDEDERPVREVRIARDFALGRHEVTVAQFRQFALATGHRTDAERNSDEGCAISSRWTRRDCSGLWVCQLPGWNSHVFSPRGFEYQIEDDQPVTCVSWRDAQAYVGWLSERAGKPYRLPSESEWEYAARARSETKYHFGNDKVRLCAYGNVADEARLLFDRDRVWANKAPCRDGAFHPVRVGSYQANAFGLHDMHGNVWEWVQDCKNGNYQGAPRDGSAWESGDCSRRILRGGSWLSGPGGLRSAFRFGYITRYSFNDLGFRVARALTP